MEGLPTPNIVYFVGSLNLRVEMKCNKDFKNCLADPDHFDLKRFCKCNFDFLNIRGTEILKEKNWGECGENRYVVKVKDKIIDVEFNGPLGNLSENDVKKNNNFMWDIVKNIREI